MGRRIGILGGTFNPMHLAHCILADQALDARQLDEVQIIPAFVAPHKEGEPVTEAKHRLEMARLAVAGRPGLVVSDREIRRKGVSYTVDTLRELQGEQPEASLFLILGADSVAGLPDWREPAEILQRATLIPVARPGQVLDFRPLAGLCPPDRLVAAQANILPMPQLEISSTDIRQRVAAGRSIRYLVAPAVEAYIKAHGLYRPAAD